MPTTVPGVFNATEAAVYLGLSDSIVRRYCRKKALKAKRFGKNWYLTKAELDRFKRKPRPMGNPNFLPRKN